MDLAQRLASDVDGAFTDVVVDHADLVYGVALQVVRRRPEAEDVAQEAFVRAYRALKGYSPERIAALRLRPWLARIALNLGRNVLRDRHPAEALEDIAEPPARDTEEPPRLIERREEHRMWKRLLDGLPPRYRLPVALRHVEGLSYPEVAETVGRPIGTVKSDVHRGVRLLRAAYDAEQRRIEEREAV